MAAEPMLTLEHVTKKFGPVTVIDDVTVHVRPGHVQVLLGENGAGKSTLIKMMAGIHRPDDGRVLVDGRPVELSDVRAAEAHGIATIHQELNLVPTLSVAENIVLGRMPPPRRPPPPPRPPRPPRGAPPPPPRTTGPGPGARPAADFSTAAG
jgi:ribose transport system ATP-binding protein